MKCCQYKCDNEIHSYYVSQGGMLIPKYIWPLCKEHLADKNSKRCFKTLREAEFARL